MTIYSKDQLISALNEIMYRGFVPNSHHGNQGGVGNTLEFLLGIEENNLPLPNGGEWEIKAQRVGLTGRTNALKTLLHCEPSPRAIKYVPRIFLKDYSWDAGGSHPDERGFRQTISATRFTDRGFRVRVDRDASKVLLEFDASKVVSDHKNWLRRVKKLASEREAEQVQTYPRLEPVPYWGFDDLRNAVGVKLLNCCNVYAATRRVEEREEYHYQKFQMLSGFKFEAFLELIEQGQIFVDIDARTGHNHGTKFRLKGGQIHRLYSEVKEFLWVNPQID